MPTDTELLRRYVDEHAEDAFAELVRRHLDFVYAAALRRTGGRHTLAEEVSQKVFSDLARKAAQLTEHPALAGWLHRSTRFAAIDSIRTELRRHKLAQSFTAMHDESSAPELPVDWEHLRPVIDDALDQLPERDRELMLLRFFTGLTFAEVGAKLNLAENTARMRTERALDKLRAHLGKHGVTSTAAALSAVLAGQSLTAAPAGLAATVTTIAVAGVPASAAAGVASAILMSKFTAPIVSAALAAGLTAIAWITAAGDIGAGELAALRAENVRLTQATAAGASAASVAAIADEFAAQATAIAQAVERKRAVRASTSANATPPAGTGSRTSPNGHRDHGQATSLDAMFSFAWAVDAGEIEALARLIWFDGNGREKALAVLATMPEPLRAQYRTPEDLYAFFLAADALLFPPPGPEILEDNRTVEVSPGRAGLVRPGRGPDRYHQYQQTPDGWKFVYPEMAVERMPLQILNSEVLAKLSTP